ncbi:MAG: hypothetical protein ACYC61_14230 [Isosphaeraceae bacterium]
MSIQLRALRVGPRTAPQGASVKGSESVSPWGRLLQAALAVYLLPALLIVLLVGGVGLIILAVGQGVGRIARGLSGSNFPAD